MRSDAVLSIDRRYRYTLTRAWGTERPFIVIGVNPSTADETKDDPTIRRCIQFAKDHGCGSLVMLNLFAYRATDVRVLLDVGEPVGDDNNNVLIHQCSAANALVVAAWGATEKMGHRAGRAAEVAKMLRHHGVVLHALSVTKGGDPGHPLYLPTTSRAVVWP